MSNPTLHRLQKKTGHEDLLEGLGRLSLSELNSVLMELFKQKANEHDRNKIRMVESVRSDIEAQLKGVELIFVDASQQEHRYHRDTRFSVNMVHGGTEYNIGDGEFVDWAEKLKSNKKERMLTSGLCTEFLFKLLSGMI